MVTASQGYSLHDTKHKIRRLDSVFHHLALDEVMVPWASDGESSSSDDQSSGFAVPYGDSDTPEATEKPKLVSMILMIVLLKMNRVNVWICLHEFCHYFVQRIKSQGFVHVTLSGQYTLCLKY